MYNDPKVPGDSKSLGDWSKAGGNKNPFCCIIGYLGGTEWQKKPSFST